MIDCYNDFVTQVNDTFIEEELEKSSQLIFYYKIKSDGAEEINIPQSHDKKEHPDEYSYVVAERRVIKDVNSQLLARKDWSLICLGNIEYSKHALVSKY